MIIKRTVSAQVLGPGCCSFAHRVTISVTEHRLHAGLLTKQKLLALLKASSQGTRDDELAFLLLVLK